MRPAVYILSALICTCAALTREDLWLWMRNGRRLEEGENIPQLAKKLGENTLVALVTKAGLATTLSGKGPFTVFGPTDAAFSALPKQLIDDLERNITLLKDVLLYHVLPMKVYSTQLKNELQVKSDFAAQPIRINIYNMGKVVTAQGSPITLVNQNATNGVIHALSRVMLPPMGTVVDVVTKIPMMFSTLTKAVVTAGLQTTLAGEGPFTVFAPTNEAFSKLPPGTLDDLLANKQKLTYVLTYHVLKGTFYSAGLTNGMQVTALNNVLLTVQISGGTVSIKTKDKNTAQVVTPDVSITNGVIHVIDQVLMPPDMY